MNENLRQMFISAFRRERTINYIVTGDSLRGGNMILGMKPYYRSMFAKINVNVPFGAQAGLTAIDWMNNVSSNTSARLSYAIAQSIGLNGIDTVLEFSFGVNDYNATPTDLPLVKSKILNAINAYLLAKPSATVVLVTPPFTGDMTKTLALRQIYIEISAELNLFMVDAYEATKNVRPFLSSGAGTGNAYYQEHTHINNNGARRLVNYIISKIVPPELLWKITPIEYSPVGTETALIEQATIDSTAGLWSQTTGVSQPNAAWRRLQEITVEPDSIMRVAHKGARRDIVFKSATNVISLYVLPDLLIGDTSWLVKIPSDVVSMKVNISTSGSSYDLLGDVPSVKNVVPLLTYDMPVDKINIGL